MKADVVWPKHLWSFINVNVVSNVNSSECQAKKHYGLKTAVAHLKKVCYSPYTPMPLPPPQCKFLHLSADPKPLSKLYNPRA